MNDFRQLILFEKNFLRDDIYKKHKYIVTESNKEISLLLSNLNLWSSEKFLILNGEKNSGKTHSCYFFAECNNGIVVNYLTCDDIYDNEKISKVDCVAIDDIDEFEDVILFHIINYLRTKKVFILLTCTKSLNFFKLRDLKSRLSAMPFSEILAPDLLLTHGIFSKMLSDYDIELNDKILEYIFSKLNCSFSSINSLIDELRQIIFIKKEKMTFQKIKEILI